MEDSRSLCVNFPESAHILDFFEHHTEDAKIWDLASKEGFVIVSNDEDFSDLVMSKGFPPKVILLKTGNQSNTYISELLKLKQTEIESFYKHPDLGVLVIK